MSLKSLIQKLDQLNEGVVNEISAADMDATSLAKHRSRLQREKTRIGLTMPKSDGGPRKSDVPAAARRAREETPLSLDDLREQEGKEIDYSTLEIDGIDYRDAPEFSDSYFSYGEYTDGTPLPDSILEKLSDDGDLRYQYLEKYLYEDKKSTDKKDKDLPFDPDKTSMSDRDQFGNIIKHKARHLAKQGMKQASTSKKSVDENSFEESAHTKTATSRLHRGTYGSEYQGDGDEDDTSAKKPATAARGRGRPRKDSDNTGQVKKYDTETLSNWIIGNLPKKLPQGVSTTRNKLRDWMEHVEAEMLAENSLNENQSGQVSIEPAKSTSHVIKQGNQVLGQVNNPQLANTIKQAMGQGQMSLAGTDVNEEEQIDEVIPALAALAGSSLAKSAGAGVAGRMAGSLAGHKIGSEIENKLDNTDEAVDPRAVTGHSMTSLLKTLDEYSRDGGRERVEPTLSKSPVRTTGKRSDGGDRFEPRYTGPKSKSSDLSKEPEGLGSNRHATRYMEEDDGEDSPLSNTKNTEVPKPLKPMYPTGKENKMKTYDVVSDKMADKMMYESKKQHYDKDMYDGDRAAKKDGMGSVVKRRKAAVAEESKPDFLDLDGDGNRKESMKKAAADKKKKGVIKEQTYDERTIIKEILPRMKRWLNHLEYKGWGDVDESDIEYSLNNPQDPQGQKIWNHIQSMPKSNYDRLVSAVQSAAFEYSQQLDEAWDTDYETPESEKGKYKGKTIAELKKMKANLMKKEKRTKTEQGKVAELNFAIRAKQRGGGKWGKVKSESRDVQMEAWDKRLSGMLMESVTVNTTTGTEPDTNSVNVSATGEDAAQLMAMLQNAGLHAGATTGGYRPVDNSIEVVGEDTDTNSRVVQRDDPRNTAQVRVGDEYDGTGSPAVTTKTPGEDPHTKFDDAEDVPIMAMPRGMGVSQNVEDDQTDIIEPVTPDEAIEQIHGDGDGDEVQDLVSFMKKIMNHSGQQYGDSAPPEQDYADERVTEDDVEEGNEFSGALAKAKASGEKDFEVDGKRYPVKEDGEDEEQEYWSEGYEDANWAAMQSDDKIQDAAAVAYHAGADTTNRDPNVSVTEEPEHGRKGDGELADPTFAGKNRQGKVTESETCNECGGMYEGDSHQCSENLNEWANSPMGQSEDEEFETDMNFMNKVISGGLNNMKQDQTTLPSTRVRTGSESPPRGADSSIGADLKRLAGIN